MRLPDACPCWLCSCAATTSAHAWCTQETLHICLSLSQLGGLVLHEGQIAEMRTGEGKTLVATLPAYINALTGVWGGEGSLGVGLAGAVPAYVNALTGALLQQRALWDERAGWAVPCRPPVDVNTLIGGGCWLSTWVMCRGCVHRRSWRLAFHLNKVAHPCTVPWLPAAGRGVHIITVNGYLAQRDAEW